MQDCIIEIPKNSYVKYEIEKGKLLVDRILDNDDHDVTKNKIIDLLTDWIQKLEEERTKIMKMTDTTPEVNPTQGYDQFVDEENE